MDGKSKRTNNPGSERMSAEQDWRYENIRRLQGAAFGFAKYRAPSDEWDHDHCRGCWAKFADLHGPGILHEGYVTALPIEETSEPEFIPNARQRDFTVFHNRLWETARYIGSVHSASKTFVMNSGSGYMREWACHFISKPTIGSRLYENRSLVRRFRTQSSWAFL